MARGSVRRPASMFPRLSFFRFSPPADASVRQIRLHGAIDTAADYALTYGLVAEIVLGLSHVISSRLFLVMSSYTLLLFFLTKFVAARWLFGRGARIPRSLILASGRGAPLSIVGSLLAVCLQLIGCALGSMGFLAVVALVVTSSYAMLAIALLVTCGSVMVVVGCAARLYRRWIRPNTDPRKRRSKPDHTKGAPNPFDEVQGLIADAILIDEAVLASAKSYDLIQAEIAFVNWALENAMLIPGEFPREAMLAYHVDYYLAEVNNGGHAQFAFNSQMLSGTIDNIERGLKAIGAADVLAIFEDFLAFMRTDSELVRSATLHRRLTGTLSTFGLQQLYASTAIKALNDRFFALKASDRIMAQNAAWLRSLPLLRRVSSVAMIAEKSAIKARNRLFAARRARLAEYRNRGEAEDPTYVAAKRLCGVAGLKFEGFTAGRAADKTGVAIWGVCTSDGVRIMRLHPDWAVLLDKDGTTSLAAIRTS